MQTVKTVLGVIASVSGAMSRFTTWAAVSLGAVTGLIWGVAAAAATTPCDTPHYHDFDFWVGDWDVYGNAHGKLAGTNRVTREHGGCVIHEHYETARGYDGESLNTYDVARDVWHQTWVDSSGLLLVLEGGLRDGKMVMEGKVQGSGGKPIPQRITWSPGPQGSVRQLWEQQGPDGTWTVVFDGTYVKKQRATGNG
jgi:hypothetical protein